MAGETENTREKKADSTIPIEDLIRSAATYGTTPEIMTGALFGEKKALTHAEAKQKLKAFLAAPVNAEPEKEEGN